MRQLRIILIIILILFSFLISSGQSTELQTKLIDSSYTWRKTTSESIDSFYFNLQPIKTSELKFHTRISLSGQTIDLYSSDTKTYQGQLLNYITEYKAKKNKSTEMYESEPHKYVFERIQLKEREVNKMVQELVQTDQMSIPTDSLITGWRTGFLHCNGLVFEFKIKQKYSKQVFNCPWGQKDSILYKKTILDNYNLLKSVFKLDSLYREFENRLAGGKTYSKDGYGMMSKMTEKQSEYWRRSKPQRDYMKSMKDTIDFHLTSMIKKQKIGLSGIDCFADYRLKFNRYGKLMSLKTSKHNKPTLKNSIGLGDYFTEKKEFRKCKSKIREIFRNIDLEFLNLKYGFYRTFNYESNNEFQLRDDTIY